MVTLPSSPTRTLMTLGSILIAPLLHATIPKRKCSIVKFGNDNDISLIYYLGALIKLSR